MSGGYKILVWTRGTSELGPAWQAMTDIPARLDTLARWGLPWRLNEPDAVARALHDADDLCTTARCWGREALVNLRVSEPGRRVDLEITQDGLWLQHRIRLERAIGGHIRSVDEVVLRGGRMRWPLAVWLCQAWRGYHRHVGGALGAPSEQSPQHRMYRLERANSAHLDDRLFGEG